jgi:hypothetical protein
MHFKGLGDHLTTMFTVFLLIEYIYASVIYNTTLQMYV